MKTTALIFTVFTLSALSVQSAYADCEFNNKTRSMVCSSDPNSPPPSISLSAYEAQNPPPPPVTVTAPALSMDANQAALVRNVVTLLDHTNQINGTPNLVMASASTTGKPYGEYAPSAGGNGGVACTQDARIPDILTVCQATHPTE